VNQIDGFLRTEGVHPADIDFEQTVELFLREMEAGLAGEPSSLQMIPSYIGERFDPRPGECVAAVDAGGTNLRVSKVRFGEDRRCTVESMEKLPMPGSRGPVEAAEFFDQLAQHLGGILEETSKIGFCFSYPVEILPNRDGRVTSLNKEVVVKGISDATIAEQLQTALANRGAKPFARISVLNDTTASLLGGRSLYEGRCGAYLGFIHGTGTNSCYYEDNASIAKAPALRKVPGRTIINLESGFFNKMKRGVLDDRFVRKTLAPGDSWLEKMTSGQYLGPLMLEYLQTAARGGLFSEAASVSLLHLCELSGKDIDDFLPDPHGAGVLAALPGLTREDKQTIYLLADALFERAAKLVAVNICACVRKTGAGADPLLPALVTVEGTTYYKAVLMRPKVEYYLHRYLAQKRGLFYRTAQVADAVTFGAAMSALSV